MRPKRGLPRTLLVVEIALFGRIPQLQSKHLFFMKILGYSFLSHLFRLQMDALCGGSDGCRAPTLLVGRTMKSSCK